MNHAFLGAGKMASAIIHGMLRARLCEPGQIIAACPDAPLLENLKNATSVRVVNSNAEAAAAAPVVLLCVKPQEAVAAIRQAGSALDGKLLISIAAGLDVASLQKMAPGCRIIRAMPNTPAIVGRGATAFTAGANATRADTDCAEAIFASVGFVSQVEEKHLDAVTGLSGSGPAYIFLVIEALTDGGVACGLPTNLARQLAIQTVLGAAELAKETGEHPAILREMVTSPGGTTAAALGELEKHGVRAAFIQAIRAADRRSKELARE
ncbi:MAG: pyrroline-5-carboxylate reductase [bacterium]